MWKNYAQTYSSTCELTTKKIRIKSNMWENP